MKLKRMSCVTLALCGFVVLSCEDSAKKPIEFATQTEAEQSYEQLESSQTDPLEIVNKVLDAAVLSESFDGSAEFGKRRLGKRQALRKGQSISFVYDSNTGYWTLDADTTEDGLNLSLFHRVRYTPRSILGFATELTDRMEYETQVNIDGTVTDTSDVDTTSVDVNLEYSENYDIQSDEPFVSNTNYITITGTTNATSQYSVEDVTVTASFRYDADALKIFGPFNDAEEEPEYPSSGVLAFTVDYSITAPGVNGSYFVEGRITFDGDNTAALEYGGHMFILNLDDGSITPA
jgi:hypothetical protein